MTDSNKLIEILDKSFAEQHEKRGLLTAQHTADDLLANGVIVPPCNIDDILYYPWIYGGTSGIALLEVSCVKIYVQGRCLVFYTDVESDMPMPSCFTIEDFGKTVFLTKEEAEQKLKELKDNANR